MKIYSIEFNDDSFKLYPYSTTSTQTLHQDKASGNSIIIMTSNDLVVKEEDVELFQTFQGGIKRLAYVGELVERMDNVLDQVYGKIPNTSEKTDRPVKIYHVTFIDFMENQKIQSRKERILGTNCRPVSMKMNKYKDFDVLQLSAIDKDMTLIKDADIGYFSNKYGGLNYIAYLGELLERERVF